MQKNRSTLIKLFSVILAICIMAVMSACGKTMDNETTETTESSVTRETTKTTETIETSKEEIWENSEVAWKSGTEIMVEVRLKPSANYTVEDSDYDSFIFKREDGEIINLTVQGMYWEKDFEALVSFFKSGNNKRVMEGKTSKTLIVTHADGSTEIVTKLSDTYCLTTIGSDEQIIRELFSSCIIQVDSKFYTPLDSSEQFEER